MYTNDVGYAELINKLATKQNITKRGTPQSVRQNLLNDAL